MNEETVIEVEHYTDRLFRFKTTRSASFKFNAGEFAMIGIHNPVLGKDIFRAYSIVSTPYDDFLEFLSIKVPNGPLTSELQKLQVGDTLKVKPKVTGSLVIDYATPKKNLVMLCTGTGIAPFMSIIRDYRSYERFERLFLFRTVRYPGELAFQDELVSLHDDYNFTYVESVSRGNYPRIGRFWKYIPRYLGGDLDKTRDAVMVCGSPELNKYCRILLGAMDWHEGNTGEMGDFLLERAFAD